MRPGPAAGASLTDGPRDGARPSGRASRQGCRRRGKSKAGGLSTVGCEPAKAADADVGTASVELNGICGRIVSSGHDER